MSKIVGSVKELAGRVSVNGVELGQPELSMLTRLGRGSFAKVIRTERGKDQKRGKSTNIWEIDPNALLTLVLDAPKAAKATEETEASTDSSETEETSAEASEAVSAENSEEAANDGPVVNADGTTEYTLAQARAAEELEGEAA